MFKKAAGSLESDILDSMEKNLVSNALENTYSFNKIAQAADYLNAAAEIFDDVGLSKEAEVITIVLEALAKSKKKVKKPSKKSKDPSTKNLTPEKMVSNLKGKGWVFNADDDTSPYFPSTNEYMRSEDYQEAAPSHNHDRSCADDCSFANDSRTKALDLDQDDYERSSDMDFGFDEEENNEEYNDEVIHQDALGITPGQQHIADYSNFINIMRATDPEIQKEFEHLIEEIEKDPNYLKKNKLDKVFLNRIFPKNFSIKKEFGDSNDVSEGTKSDLNLISDPKNEQEQDLSREGSDHEEFERLLKELNEDSEAPKDNEAELPDDYEPCGECGFDHEYEPEEANRKHQELIKNKKHPYYDDLDELFPEGYKQTKALFEKALKLIK